MKSVFPVFQAVLFDLDDTLLDRRAAYDYAYHRFYDEQPAIHKACSWEEARTFFWWLSPNNATDARAAIVEIMRRWPGVNSDPETHHRYYFESLIDGLGLLPGVREFLAGLSASRLPWGVVTNGGPYQLRKVEKTGLATLIPFMVVSQLFGAEKPEPAIYHEAVRLLGLNGTTRPEPQRIPRLGPEKVALREPQGIPYGQILFVGDNPHTDIAGAHRVGMKTAWVKMGREYASDAPRPDYVIERVTELRPVLGLR